MEFSMVRRFVSLVAGLTLASACIAAHAADVAAGKEKAELCVGCHGENGISQTENLPSLAGQPDQFIQWQLVYFRAGTRKNEQMQPVIEQINNEDIRNLGAYFASVAPPLSEEEITALAHYLAHLYSDFLHPSRRTPARAPRDKV